MASTFFGLTIASSGLSTFQTAINTTANNISNVDTEGYSRQEAIKTAAMKMPELDDLAKQFSEANSLPDKRSLPERLDVKFRLFIDTLAEQFRFFLVPVFKGIDWGDMPKCALRDVVVVSLPVVVQG